jgi:hypothetical protein
MDEETRRVAAALLIARDNKRVTLWTTKNASSN